MLIKKQLVCVFILFFVFFTSCVAQVDKRLTFVIPDFKPYTYHVNGGLKGIGVDAIDEIFKQLGIEYSLTLVPNYGRAVLEVKSGRADGFFLASKNNQRDEIAIFSEPVTTNRWSWFLPIENKMHPSDRLFKQNARILTHLNTNTHKWLKKNGYVHVKGIPNLKSIPEKLNSRSSYTAIFLAEMVFFQLAEDYKLDLKNYQQIIEVEKPFGIYIAKQYLKNHPKFMQQLNAVILNRKKNK
jgi:polar amino acid transport system substrate-binding protein